MNVVRDHRFGIIENACKILWKGIAIQRTACA